MSEFFGELYLRSTRPFLSGVVTEAEARFLKANLKPGRWLDLGCGHGRHLAHLGGFGVDGDALSLREAKQHGHVARARFDALPFRDNSFDGAWCWYNSLGTLEDDAVPPVLAEAARVLKPGAMLIIQGTNIATVEGQPAAGFDGPVGEGDHLIEKAHFNAARRRDEVHRTLRCSDGRTLEAGFFIRYYTLPEWTDLLTHAGFDVRWHTGGVDGSLLSVSSPDLIVGAQKREHVSGKAPSAR